MEISKNEMKEYIKKIYERLDKVSPVDFDCGKLCGEINVQLSIIILSSMRIL